MIMVSSNICSFLETVFFSTLNHFNNNHCLFMHPLAYYRMNYGSFSSTRLQRWWRGVATRNCWWREVKVRRLELLKKHYLSFQENVILLLCCRIYSSKNGRRNAEKGKKAKRGYIWISWFLVLSTMKRVDWDCHMKINIFMIFSFWTLEIEKFKFGSK